jgi:alkanesulfonate monooxygenase SsuD/methylene tetrahydromethanopterin reductase-like flavin-dependent oxidoreductase (luciferase family)
MCHLGGAMADGVLLNWMLPAQAAQARGWVQQGAHQAGRAAPVVASYVRIAVGPGSRQRLRDEESHFRNINEAHRQHLEAMDSPLGSVGMAASARPEGSPDSRHTTPCSTFRSHGCSQTRMHPAAHRRDCRGAVSTAQSWWPA